MKPKDIIKLYEEDYPKFQDDIAYATNFEKGNQLKRAGEKYRHIAKKLLQLKLNTFAIDFYSKASEVFSNGKYYEKVIGTELSIYQIHRININLSGMASTYEKIATYYKSFLSNPITAGNYFLMSAKHHEENKNYRSAFTKAKYACDCFKESNNKTFQIESHALAFRMAVQSRYYERAGIYAKKWLQLVPKDYSVHYLSICMRGYKSLLNTDITSDTLMFVSEIIIAHFEKNMPQENILKYLEDGQKLHLREHKEINKDYNQKSLDLLGDNLQEQIKYSIEFKCLAQNLGLIDISDYFYIQEKDLRRKLSKKNNSLAYMTYSFWKYSSGYGTSLLRWLLSSFIIITVFGAIYSRYSFNISSPKLICILEHIKPSISISGVDNCFSPFYYSVVTFATLGYGDITPSDLSGQIFSVFEVIIGYLMLGGLLSVFSKKIIR